jgi:UDP-glucose 4-epimerase
MKIMITGGAGFVGSHLAEYLLKKHHKIVICTKTSVKNVDSIRDKIELEKIDVTNYTKLEKFVIKKKPDVIIHLAGNTSHSKSFESPFNDLDSNTKSTLNILEIIRKTLPKCKFILGSTFVVIGKPDKLPVNEQTACNPTTLYGVNRLSGEYYTKIYNQVYGINTNIFRITNSFGPKEQIIPNKNAINYLIHKAFKNEDITIYNEGKFFRDVIFISDVVNAINQIIKKGKPGELYWISSNKKTWFYQIGNELEKLTKGKIKYVKQPKYTKKVDVGNFVVNNSKMKKLGWKPKVSVKEGIIETLKYFKENNM